MKLNQKLKNASLAEKYYINTLTPSSSREEVLIKYDSKCLDDTENQLVPKI